MPDEPSFVTIIEARTRDLGGFSVGRVLTELGLPESTAEETVRIFTLHDERLLRRAASHHADMPKLIEIARAGRAELRSLFEQDRR